MVHTVLKENHVYRNCRHKAIRETLPLRHEVQIVPFYILSSLSESNLDVAGFLRSLRPGIHLKDHICQLAAICICKLNHGISNNT